MGGVQKLDYEEIPPIAVPGGLLAREAYRGRDFAIFISSMEPGAGESWHTHLEDVEAVYFTIVGRGRITWREGGSEHEITVGPGDLVSINGGVENQTENVGTGPWIKVAIHSAGVGTDILRLREK